MSGQAHPASRPGPAAPAGQDPVEWLAGQQAAMLALLARMVDQDSGSYDKPGVDAVGELVCGFLAGHGIAVERVAGARMGDCLIARVPGGQGDAAGSNRGGKVLLLGHRDTVFPKGEAGRRPFTVQGGVATGPGVADMKAGLVMNCFVLAAFAQAGAQAGLHGAGAPPLEALFTGDEEIGSPEGRAVIERQARGARAVLNAEPGRPSGAVVTGRKGGVFSAIRITGRAAHSGGNFEAGVSAIEELACKVQALHALTRLERGITVNVGLVSGGQSVNTVAPEATCEVDLRYVEAPDRDELMGAIAAIVARSFVPGTAATLEIRGEFLPLTQTPDAARLFQAYVAAAAESGLTVTGEFTGGCADSGFTAAVGAPTLCATGPVGGKAHTPEEFLQVDSLVPRAQAAARTILGLGT